MQNTVTTIEEAVRVIWVEEDADWKAEFEEYGYDTDMFAYYGDGDLEVRNNLQAVDVLKDEQFGFMCGNTSDRRVYGFTVDVYKAEEEDGSFSFWITSEAEEAIG